MEGDSQMKKLLLLTTAIVLLSLALTPSAVAQITTVQTAMSSAVQKDADPFTVVPFEFDPFGTNLVRSRWLTGVGCPTGATTNDGTTSSTLTDSACQNGDSKDKQNEGLLLVKTGPTPNFAAAGAKLEGVKGITLTELGYDLRKPASAGDPRGSHCGAGAPRFNVVTSDGVNHFVGCNSPPAMLAASSASWIRLRWGPTQLAAAFPPIMPVNTITSITIIFDEGTDTGPDNFGLAVLDNVDVNATLVGKGPGS
jgi:hypothetical protein